MHLCLQLHEILDVILEYIPDNSSLAPLARVCKAFKDPVLDVLYAEMDFDTLLMTVDPKLCGWEFRMVHLDIGTGADSGARHQGAIDVWRTLEFKRRLSSRDWDILLPYAARVKKLSYPCSSRKAGRVRSNIGRALSPCPVPCLFPKLKKLQILLHDDMVSSLPLFSGHSLQELIVDDELENISSGSAIQRMTLDCPFVNSFAYSQIYRRAKRSCASAIFPDVFSQWSCLKSLDCKELDKQTLEVLPHLSNLRTLHLCLNPNDPWLLDGTQSYLRCLDELHIRADSYKTCASAIALLFSQRQLSCSSYSPASYVTTAPLDNDPPDLSHPRVRSLYITITPTFGMLTQHKSQGAPPSHLSLTPLSDALAEFIAPDALTHLRIENKSAYTSYSALFDEPTGLERLSRTFGRIERMDLVLSPKAALDMGAERVIAVLGAWPCLKRAHLRLRDALGLKDMGHVLGVCPRMEWMDVNVVVRARDVGGAGGNGLLIGAPNLDSQLTHVWMDWEADGLERPSQSVPTDLVSPTACLLKGTMPCLQCVGHRYVERGRVRYQSLEDFENNLQKAGHMTSSASYIPCQSLSPWCAVLEEVSRLRL
ncbi:hypothetical protein CONPUDRAFT_160322 [Coniophora puteana RWD-64-598 SS2]|uniref:F-box domain-containing protein n=1 Tax=Coniophora puteana (strain RWD-64-598) TaxID=741705 RepID=R7SEW6_CONPW|nr:uncharacterized protein CONPUDRAFT_160322 [Coniophora puteana RWD-64-598 SS2]EIW74282.1 hypothetical protein CONPUDRAFT_160322 [Coniophora puteana RWD-64-598 SS2]